MTDRRSGAAGAAGPRARAGATPDARGGIAPHLLEVDELAAWADAHLGEWLARGGDAARRAEGALLEPARGDGAARRVENATLELLRDVPGRRWTARCRLALHGVDEEAGASVVLKRFAKPKAARRLARHLRTLNLAPEGRNPRFRRIVRPIDPPIRFPALLGFDAPRSIVATEFLPGETLEQALPALDLDRVMQAAGALLARFHRGHADTRKRVTPRQELVELRAAARVVRAAFPELGPRLDGLIATLSRARVEQRRGRPALLHGSFRPNHLLIDGPSLAVVDLESLRSGPAAYDIGNWIASLYYLECEERIGTASRRRILRAFLEGYAGGETCTATALEASWYAGDLLIQKQALKYATRFRERRERKAERMLALAEEILACSPKRRECRDLAQLWRTLP